MFIAGFGCICCYSNWQTSLGIFLVLWANNNDIIDRTQRNSYDENK